MPMSFRVKDLMINVIPQTSATGGGSIGLVGPDDDINDFPTPLTPVINVALWSPHLKAVKDLGLKNLSPEGYNKLAVEIGKAALAGLFLCSQDMPTCEANERVSPFASGGLALCSQDMPTCEANERVSPFASGGLALCSQDMPTCEANERVSPFASGIPALRFEDIVIAKDLLLEDLALISKLEEIISKPRKAR